MPPFKTLSVIALMGVSATLLSGCGNSFETAYSAPGPAAAKTQWRVTGVRVNVPADLVVSEENSFIPRADIVWHGDPAGDRRAQVAAIVKTGIERGFAGLKGRENVVATVTLRRFHALTMKAYMDAPNGTGVHSVRFDLQINDARTGKLVFGPTEISADMPATLAGEAAPDRIDSPGQIWKAEIEAHIAATIRDWLGVGPEVRDSFNRLGG